MRIETTDLMGDPAPGFAIWGNPPGDNEDLIFTDGFPFTDSGVTQFSVDLRYSINVDSPGLIIIQFFFEGEPAGMGNIGPGTYAFEVSGEQMMWQTETFDIMPAIGTDIDACAIAFASNNAADDEATYYVGDFLEVDNMMFVGSEEMIPGGNLDTWIPAFPVETPDDWFSFVIPTFSPIEKTEDAAEGMFAAKMTTSDFNGEISPSILSQGEPGDEFLPTVETGDDFYGVTFQYKYETEATDSAAVFVVVGENMNPGPDEQWFDLVLLEAEEEYTTITLDYSDIGEFIQMNYISIAFVSSYDNSFIPDGNIPQANSTLFIDDIQFLYQETDVCDFDVNIAQGSSIILCPDEVVTLNVEDTYDSYQWYRQPMFGGPVEELTGETMNTLDIDAFNFSVYEVWCEATFEGCTEESDAIAVDGWVFTPTVVSFTETDICEGESATLEALGATGTYQWYMDGNEIPEATSQTYDATESGGYTASIFPGECPNYELNNGIEVNINVNPLPEPTLDYDLEFQIAVTNGPFETYEWYLDGDLLEGVEFEGDIVFPPTAGTVYVIVTDANGCSGQSDDFISSVTENDQRNFQMYPVPANDQLILNAAVQGNYRVIDIAGRIAANGFAQVGTNTIDVSSLSNGVYFLELNDTRKRLIIQHK